MPGRTIRWKVREVDAGKRSFFIGETIDSHVLEQAESDEFD
jgi:hypothetical protein